MYRNVVTEMSRAETAQTETSCSVHTYMCILDRCWKNMANDTIY